MNKPILAALVAAGMMLSACGGGGGGGSGPTRPSDAVPVSGSSGSATADDTPLAPLGQIAASDHHIDLTQQTALTAPGLGSFDTLNGTVAPDVSVSNAPSIRVKIDALGVDDVFDSTTAAVVTASGFFRVDTATIESGGTRRTVSYIVPDTDSSNPYRLQFSSLGVWDTADLSGHINEVVAFSVGSRTAGPDIPTTGTATYFGYMLGVAIEGASQYSVGANASALANFGTRNVSFQTQNSVKTDRVTNEVTSAAGYDMTGTLVYPAATNALSGTVTTADGKTGTATGNFYGPQAAELGMTFKATSSTGTLVGGAALKR
jgi:transferrin binding protein